MLLIFHHLPSLSDWLSRFTKEEQIARILGYGDFSCEMYFSRGLTTLVGDLVILVSVGTNFVMRDLDSCISEKQLAFIRQFRRFLVLIYFQGLLSKASRTKTLVIGPPSVISSYLRFLKTKDEAPAAIIKCIKNIQVRLKATVWNVRIDNGTEFVNQTLRECLGHELLIYLTPANPVQGRGSNPVSQQLALPTKKGDD
ncbi:hypothetical protein Tco_1274052 [Tanacetum coccineum]